MKTATTHLHFRQQQESSDGVKKYLFALADNLLIESVLIPDDVYKKLGVMSTHDDTPIAEIASQAIQEWVSTNFGSRYPTNP